MFSVTHGENGSGATSAGRRIGSSRELPAPLTTPADSAPRIARPRASQVRGQPTGGCRGTRRRPGGRSDRPGCGGRSRSKPVAAGLRAADRLGRDRLARASARRPRTPVRARDRRYSCAAARRGSCGSVGSGARGGGVHRRRRHRRRGRVRLAAKLSSTLWTPRRRGPARRRGEPRSSRGRVRPRLAEPQAAGGEVGRHAQAG